MNLILLYYNFIKIINYNSSLLPFLLFNLNFIRNFSLYYKNNVLFKNRFLSLDKQLFSLNYSKKKKNFKSSFFNYRHTPKFTNFFFFLTKHKRQFKKVYRFKPYSLAMNNYFLKKQFNILTFKCFLIGSKIEAQIFEIKRLKKWKLFKKSFQIRYTKQWYLRDKIVNSENKLLSKFFINLIQFSKNNNSVIFGKKGYNIKSNLRNFMTPNSTFSLVKYFYYTHFFQLIKLRISYKRLMLIARHFKTNYPLNYTPYKFKNPYMFLHISRSKVKKCHSVFSEVLKSYKVFRKLFRTFKRPNKLNKSKIIFNFNLLNFTKKTFFFIKKKKSYKFFSKKINFNYNFSSNNKIKLINHTNQFSLNTFNNFIHILSFSLNNNKINSKILKQYIFFYKNKNSKYKFRKFCRKFKFSLKTIFKKRFYSCFKTLPLITTSFSNIPYILQLNKSLTFKYFNKISSFMYLVPFKKNFNKKVNNSSFIKKTRNLFFYSNAKLPFILNRLGFLFISNTYIKSPFYSTRLNVSAIRRLKYSFAFRNDILKHVLKKYTYMRLAYKVSSNWQSKDYSTNNKIFFAQNFFLQKYERPLSKFLELKSTFSLFIPIASSKKKFLLERFSTKLAKSKYKPQLHIHVIRFKPGYMRYWRNARRDLQIKTRTFFRYQHQLTNYLILVKRLSKIQNILSNELKIKNFLMRTRFVLDLKTAEIFIDSRLVFINSICCLKYDFQLFANDFLQLIVTYKYYVAFRWMLNHNLKVKMKLKKFTSRYKRKKKERNPDKKYRNNLPLWLSPHLNLRLDIIKYIELDFFTLSAFVIYDPLLLSDINIYTQTIERPHIYNMYNWKYIT